MRKLILLGLMAAIAIPGVANAQSRDEVRRDRQELRGDLHELRRDTREWHRDHRGSYVAPYGSWRNRPVTVGYQKRPALWGNRYVVSDYGWWNLAAPRMNQRWVRYGDDLLMVNTRSGRVVRVIHDRF